MSSLGFLQRIRSRLLRDQQDAPPPQLRRLESYAAHARRAGIDRLYLFLSFDCDTDLDIDAVDEVHRFLVSKGIKATYAVPGAQLEKGASAYRKLADSGAEFMNHGSLPHAEWRGDRWVGITFYDKMSEDVVVADIRRGHEIVTTVIGRPPCGFRAPHFGCYQQPEQVEVLHRTAAALGYSYCSTTIPAFAMQKGPAYLTHGLVEFPCFGSARNLETILDSWTYLTDRKDYALGEEYYALFAETLNTLVDHHMPAVLTWYADPCHVLDQPPFIKAIELAASRAITSVTGSGLVNIVRPALTGVDA